MNCWRINLGFISVYHSVRKRRHKSNAKPIIGTSFNQKRFESEPHASYTLSHI
ncbi:hypothetical protein Hdeb2414_s0003g00094661 [Helianthus debilis subsp. tardiflorus]